MSLVPKDEMTTLRSASQSLETANSAEEDIQLKAVAYAINSAANTGQKKVIYQEEILPSVKEQLESNGYKLKQYAPCYPERHTVISWEE